MTSGVVLAGRYELADLVSERLGSVTWRAVDIILNRNVGAEILPSDDPRAAHFLAAARESTGVTDARFLRVLDLFEREHGHHVVVREWARAFGLDQLLAQTALPGRRAADIVTEVAEALAEAHAQGLYHGRLAPHHVLVKESGAVRIVGLGLAAALEPAEHVDTPASIAAHLQSDVRALGQLLYACLVAHWPDGATDLMPAAPVENGRVLRPRQVRAGVSKALDSICDRILNPEAHPHGALTTADDVARALQVLSPTTLDTRRQASSRRSAERASPDLLRADPVVEPKGPVPGLAATRRPRAFEPPPPTRLERAQAMAVDATRGDRSFMLAGIIGVVILALTLAFFVFRAAGVRVANPFTEPSAHPIAIAGVDDFDPEGDDRENPGSTALAIDGDPSTGWETTTYFNRADFGGLKDGVGVVLDLTRPRRIEEVRLEFQGTPTSVRVYASRSRSTPPHQLAGLVRLGSLTHAGRRAVVPVEKAAPTRFLVVWLTSLPEVEPSRFRGEIREITVHGTG